MTHEVRERADGFELVEAGSDLRDDTRGTGRTWRDEIRCVDGVVKQSVTPRREQWRPVLEVCADRGLVVVPVHEEEIDRVGRRSRGARIGDVEPNSVGKAVPLERTDQLPVELRPVVPLTGLDVVRVNDSRLERGRE